MSALRRDAIAPALAALAPRVCGFELLAETGSTNRRLAEVTLPADGAAWICIADVQTAGQGRAGRGWLAPPGQAITFSLARTFDAPAGTLGTLALVTGILVGETLNRYCTEAVRLKWPNDLVASTGTGRSTDPAKLGGILIELAGERAGPARAVIGVGINHAGAGAVSGALDRPVSDLETLGLRHRRDEIIALLLSALVPGLDAYAESGFDACWRRRWAALDALAGQRVRVQCRDGNVVGQALGIDTDGALRVDTANGIERFHSGDVSVRTAESA